MHDTTRHVLCVGPDQRRALPADASAFWVDPTVCLSVSSNWMTAIDMIDDDTYVGAENYYNLFTVRKNSDAATDEERSRLQVVRGV